MPAQASLRRLGRGVRSASQRATFFRFACVGGAIAILDVSLLYALKDVPGFNVYLARLISYTAAMTCGYFLNRHFTFHHLDRQLSPLRELLRFYSVHALGGLLNYAVFSLIVTLGAGLEPGPTRTLMPLIGVWVGGIVGMCFNFLLSRRLVFGPQAGRKQRGP